MEIEEYQKRLATAINLLGEEAGKRYMEQRLRDLRSDIEQRLTLAVKERLGDLTWPQPVVLYVDIGPHGVRVRIRGRVKSHNSLRNNQEA